MGLELRDVWKQVILSPCAWTGVFFLMTAIGFDIKKNEMRYTVLEGKLNKPKYVDHGGRIYDANLSRPDLAAWFKQNFIELIVKNGSPSIAYRVSINVPKIEQIAYMHYPWGVLNLLSHERGLHISEFNSKSFTAKRFGLARGSKPAEIVDNYLGTHPPYWDDLQRSSALAAWALL